MKQGPEVMDCRRAEYDVTNKIDTTDPSAVSFEVAQIYERIYQREFPSGVLRVFADIDRLFQETRNRILPVCWLDSINACACAASASGSAVCVTTRILPLAMCGHTCASSSRATRALKASGRVRSVEPV